MKIAVIGCGYVATMYARTLSSHPGLQLVGAFDTHEANLASFVERWPCRRYQTLSDLLTDPDVELVLNLTNPRSHFDVTLQSLEAGKHVYSEKPLAMTPADAGTLVRVASERRVTLSSAPCSVLSQSAQTLWHAIDTSAIGKVRLVYANFDDGMIAPHQSPWLWRDERGVHWPAQDEFEVGCTYEHAGYVLTWLCAFFGPVRRVTSFASLQLPDKGIPVASMAPDFAVGCLEFDAGVVARVTCGLVAPRDKSITVVGDGGVLFVGNVRDDHAPVLIRRNGDERVPSALTRRLRPVTRWLESRLPPSAMEWLSARRYPPVPAASHAKVARDKPVDFCLGPAEMAAAIQAGRSPLLSAQLGAHIVEIIEVLQYPGENARRVMTTTFDPIRRVV